MLQIWCINFDLVCERIDFKACIIGSHPNWSRSRPESWLQQARSSTQKKKNMLVLASYEEWACDCSQHLKSWHVEMNFKKHTHLNTVPTSAFLRQCEGTSIPYQLQEMGITKQTIKFFMKRIQNRGLDLLIHEDWRI